MKRLIAILLIITTTLSACSSSITIEGPELPKQIGQNFPLFTKQQILEDFDELIETLDKNYPHFSSARELYGGDRDELVASYRSKIEGFPEEVNLSEAAQVFVSFGDDLGRTGHLIIYNQNQYEKYYTINEINQDKYADSKKIFERLNNETTRAAYEYLSTGDAKYREVFRLNPVSEIPVEAEGLEEINDNLSYKIIDGSTVYLRILSFEVNNMENDERALSSFYNEIRGYENLIIDLTLNGGGSDNYWMDYIVAPNITEELEMRNFAMVKDQGIYKGNTGNKDINRESENYKMIAELPEISNEILSECGLAIPSGYTVSPSGDEKAFDGNIYVLVGPNVFSASEGFARFCKSTGFAALVGQNTGGDGGSLAIRDFYLPNTGMLFTFATYYVLNPDGSSNTVFGTKPDYYSEDNENALEACLRVILPNR